MVYLSITFWLHDYLTVFTILFSEMEYYPMLEEGYSFFEIKTPWKMYPPANQKLPLNPANFGTPFIFQTQNGQNIQDRS